MQVRGSVLALHLDIDGLGRRETVERRLHDVQRIRRIGSLHDGGYRIAPERVASLERHVGRDQMRTRGLRTQPAAYVFSRPGKEPNDRGLRGFVRRGRFVNGGADDEVGI